MNVYVAILVDKDGAEIVGAFELVKDAKKACEREMGRDAAWKWELINPDGERWALDNVNFWYTPDYDRTYYVKREKVR